MNTTADDSLRSRPMHLGFMLFMLAVVGPFLTAGAGLMLQSIWVDEIFTMHAAGEGLWQAIVISMQNHAMPFYAVLSWAASLGGESLLGARLLSLVAFIGAAIFFHRAAESLFDRGTAYWATGAFVFNPLLVWHAQDARMYTPGLFLAMLALWLALKALDTGARGYQIALGVVTFFGLTNHLYFVFVILCIGILALLYTPRRHVVGAIAPLVIGGLLAAPVMAAMLLMADTFPGHEKGLSLASLGYPALTMGAGYSVGATKAELHQHNALDAMKPYLSVVIPAILAFWVPILYGAGRMLKLEPRKFCMVAPFAAFIILLPFALAFVTGNVSFNVRYILPAVPAVLLAFAYGVTHTKSSWKWVVVFLLFGVQAYGLWEHYTEERHWKEDYRSALTYLNAELQPGDLLYSNPDYTLRQTLEGVDVFYLDFTTYEESLERSGRKFYVINRPWVADPDGRLHESLSQTPGVAIEEFRGIAIYVVPESA